MLEGGGGSGPEGAGGLALWWREAGKGEETRCPVLPDLWVIFRLAGGWQNTEHRGWGTRWPGSPEV